MRLAEIHPGRVSVITPNVDGLHARAGSRNVIELHGSLAAHRCSGCARPYPLDRVLELADGGEEVPPPPCPQCGNLIRPGVVWFGEALPSDALQQAWRVAQSADVALVVGTSSLVCPAAELPAVV